MILDNDTPVSRVEIEIKGDNKWLTIIQNVSKTCNWNKIVNQHSLTQQNIINGSIELSRAET